MEERRPRAAPKPGVCVELAETAAAISMLALGQDLPMGQVQFFFFRYSPQGIQAVATRQSKFNDFFYSRVGEGKVEEFALT